MEHTLSTVLVIWGLIGSIALWFGANALADFGARRLRHWLQSTRRHPHLGDEQRR